KGKTTLIAGDPGLGKSQQTLSLAATVSCGGLLPDGTRAERGKVIVVSAEDDPADTIKPRLEVAGADLGNVFIVDFVRDGFYPDGTPAERGFSLSEDLQQLGKMIEDIGGVSLVVIDPVSAYLGRTDSHKNADVRAILAPLSKLAEQYGAAVVVVSHLNKTTGGNALARVNGSGAFGAAARAAYLVIRDPADDDRRLFLPMKNNLGADQTGLAFTIESVEVESAHGPIQTSRVVWDAEAVTMTATEALQATAGDSDERSAVADAAEWLAELLEDGPVPQPTVKAECGKAGFSWATVRRAKSSLQVKAIKEGRTGWLWRLESEDAQTCSRAENLSTFRNLSTFQPDNDQHSPKSTKGAQGAQDAHTGTGEHLQAEVEL
ncbi:MAG: AAA family ATPase, partial [Planctomycetota bacterium]